jgi:hypothetical protein
VRTSSYRPLNPSSSGIGRIFQDPHKSAAVVYAVFGSLVILITFVAGLVPEGRPNAALELGIGVVFVIIFAVLIYRGWWLLSALLVFSNTWRVFTFFNDGRGAHVELLPLRVIAIEPQPVAFINAALMLIITFMLARSAWIGFSRWLAKRQEHAK